jgi:protoporphyrinogen oxidase
MKTRVVIIGAGPAGLTAAHELAQRGVRDVVVLEATGDIGGLSKTVNHRGNRIDIGGHRFFSKSDWVMDWWLRMLPLVPGEEKRGLEIAYHGQRRNLDAAQPSAAEPGMLVRSRLSRIYFNGRFFDYPLKANLDTALKLGLVRCLLFAASYARARLFPRPERSLEDFFVNRFGRRLYLQFFKSYTEKVWGAACTEISAEWGAQRVKSMSIGKALRHAVRRLLGLDGGAAQATSLIERFLYPKHGPGLMWETTAQALRSLGVRIEMRAPVARLEHSEETLRAVITRDPDGVEHRHEADYVISTMPVKDLVLGLRPAAPAPVREVAGALQYRDFITVGLLYRKLASPLPDNWIYIQEPGVQVGRLQIFNNWSPAMVAEPDKTWVGLEYFCREGDGLWAMRDEDLIALAAREMARLRLADAADRLDGVVIRMPKAYPAYHGAYARFAEVRRYLDAIPNLFLAGRNGMHRYNNQDHSMLSAKLAVDAILAGSADKSAIWGVNVDDEYHEEKAAQGGNADESRAVAGFAGR